MGILRCPPDDALWHEVNDNIGDRPHVVFPGTAVGLVREGVRVTATPNDIVFYRPYEIYRRELRDARGDVCLFIAPTELDVPAAPLGRADARSFLLERLDHPSIWPASCTSPRTTSPACSASAPAAR